MKLHEHTSEIIAAPAKPVDKLLLFEALYREHFPLLLAHAKNIIGQCSKEQDVVQDVFMKLWNMRDKIETIDDVSAFLHRMVYNECIDRIRKSKKDAVHHQRIKSSSISSHNKTQDILDSMEYDRILQKAIGKLSPQRRKVFMLGKLEGWPRKEIAKALNLSEITVRECMRLAIQTVKKYVQSEAGLVIKERKAKGLVKKPGEFWIEKEVLKVA